MKIRPRKSLGQHFLEDPNLLRKITAEASLGPDDVVVEIGPGLGTLTSFLAERAGKVYGIEIDPRLAETLGRRFAGSEKVEILIEDALRFDFASLFRQWGRKLKVVANLPYEISSPIIFRLIKEKEREYFSLLVLMLQLEVARRVVAQPGTKDYGPMSLWVQLYTRAEIAFRVRPEVFHPRPKVESAVVKFEVLPQPTLQVKDEQLLHEIIRSAFAYRRKTLVNALRTGMFSDASRDKIEKALQASGIPLAARGEDLTLKQFRDLSSNLARGS